VTLFGESAGAEDALILASSDAAKGLFNKVIAESAGGLWDRQPTLTQAQTQGAKLATALGLPGDSATAAQLRSLPSDRLAAVSDDDQIGPMVDGCIVQAPPSVSLAHGVHVPLIIGTNGDEDPGYFTAPARWVAARTASAGARVYLYRFDYVWSILAARRPGATHGSEVPFVFDNYDSELFDEGDRKIAAALHGCWIAFARTGTPACPGVADWPAYDPLDRRVVVFTTPPAVRDPGDSDALDLLERKLFPH
jgi:para-nitrobenzyl esterase